MTIFLLVAVNLQTIIHDQIRTLSSSQQGVLTKPIRDFKESSPKPKVKLSHGNNHTTNKSSKISHVTSSVPSNLNDNAQVIREIFV